MKRVLALISISETSFEQLKADVDLQQREMQFIRQWQQQGILENFFVTASRTGAVLIFKSIDEPMAKQLIEILPYYPFMSEVQYFDLNKHF